MGPRPLGRGRRSGRLALRWFQGRQWGRDLSAAEGDVLELRAQIIDVRQWGRDLSATEGGTWCGQREQATMASMGPRPLGRGRSLNPPSENGPIIRRQWGRDLSAAEGHKRVRAVMSTMPRQWGRDLSAAEGRGRARLLAGSSRVNGAATSRPRKGAADLVQFGDGTGVNGAATSRPRKGEHDRLPVRGRDGVNGAATSRPRKAPVLEGRLCRVGASMGPRPLGRGRFLAGMLGGTLM